MDEDERVVQVTNIIGGAVIGPVAKQRARYDRMSHYRKIFLATYRAARLSGQVWCPGQSSS